MNYGFLIDNKRCIGCHACSTACKSENEVPLGVYRTWVKYVEQGVYPNTQRSFQVTRCNHCENPPCVRICPVSAMVQRDDGIVDFDSEACIGCKACMQACPYDAIHIDPQSGTAAKCNFCAHRVTQGLEPACVVVCPTHAIIAGDLDDPNSEIGKLLPVSKTTVRKPEQGTSPNLFYIEGDSQAMHPTALPDQPGPLIFSEGRLQLQGVSPEPIKKSVQGLPKNGPIAAGGATRAEQMVQLAYDVRREIPWHWQVPAYLVTKGISSGLFLFLAVGLVFGWFDASADFMAAAGAVGVVAMLATLGLLVADLERPERFFYILTRPQWKSWLTRGAFVVTAFSAVTGLWFAAELGSALGWFALPDVSRLAMAWLTIPLAVAAAVYTAFLFGQAEGRDLWQSPLLPIHLLIQATMIGAGAVFVLTLFVDASVALSSAARLAFMIGIGLDLFVILLGEFGIPHASEVAARAAHRITHGPHARTFWGGAMFLGHLVPLVLLALEGVPDAGAAGLGIGSAFAVAAALVGLYCYEHVFVMAPQEIPNS